jgi:predicted secreted Zn-dependent protease
MNMVALYFITGSMTRAGHEYQDSVLRVLHINLHRYQQLYYDEVRPVNRNYKTLSTLKTRILRLRR